MFVRHVGYAGTNVSLQRTTGRTLRLANLGQERVFEVIAENLQTVVELLEWNVAHGLGMLRISSSVVPFASHERFTWDWREHFADELAHIAHYVDTHELRLSMHPGQYTVLNSPKADVVARAIAELEFHAVFLDAATPDGGDIVLHVGGAYGDKASAMDRFAVHYDHLSELARSQLVLENDDTVYTLDDVLGLCQRIGAPLVFDIFHHRCHHEGDHWRADLIPRLNEAMATWGDAVPKCHISSQRPGTRTAHADYIDPQDLQDFVELARQVNGDSPIDLMVEAKQKELAALEVRRLL